MITALVVASLFLTIEAPAAALDSGALPTRGQVTSGNASMSKSGNSMTVNQTTDKVIAEWDTFNIGTNDSVAFAQPGASSIALNRISDQSASHTDTWFTHGQRPGIPPGLQWGYIRVNGTGQDLGFVGKENQIANLIGPETGSETLAA